MEEEMIELTNKDKFLDVLRSIDGVDFDYERLVMYLDDNGFFTAPATATHSYAYEGGLCEHSLDVYNTLNTLCSMDDSSDFELDQNSIKIVGLFHDLYKCNYYEKYMQNKKVYIESGTKKDNLGKFEWMSVEAYKVKDATERIVYGDGAFTSYMMLSKFIPLTDYEVVALINHNCGMDNGYSNKDLGSVLSTNKLAIYLHCADMICTYHKPLVDFREFEEEPEDDDVAEIVVGAGDTQDKLVSNGKFDFTTTKEC